MERNIHAMSQFAYGRIEEARIKGELLPVPGGFDRQGNLTQDPLEIEQTWRVLPTGFWKGSGLSLVMDMVGAMLAGGNTVTDIGRRSTEEYALSQVFIALHFDGEDAPTRADSIANRVIEDIKSAAPAFPGGNIFYPGEREFLTRQESMKNGIPVLEEVWQKISALE